MGGEIVPGLLVADVVGRVQDELEDLDEGFLEETGRIHAMRPLLARDIAHRDTGFFGSSEIFAIERIDAREKDLGILAVRSNCPLKDIELLLLLVPDNRMIVSHISFPPLSVVMNYTSAYPLASNLKPAMNYTSAN